MARTTDAELRAEAKRLLEERRGAVSEPPEEEEEEEEHEARATPKRRTSPAMVATGGVSGAALLAVIAQLLQGRVSPEQLKAMTERLDTLERHGVERRSVEYERDLVENCRVNQVEEFVQTMLPRPDSMVGTKPRPWFDRCPPMPDPTKGVKLPTK